MCTTVGVLRGKTKTTAQTKARLLSDQRAHGAFTQTTVPIPVPVRTRVLES